MVIDIHVHAFPDSLARRAVPALEHEGEIKAVLDGTIASLLASMDTAGIDASVVASIATKPGQFESIMAWSREIDSERILPFPSIHPADPLAVRRVETIAEGGFRGIKLHPYYQEFSLEEERIHRLFEAISKNGLVLLLHTGYDLAFDRYRIATPSMISDVVERNPELKLIATHFGAWEDWDEAERWIIGREVYIDTSYSIPFLGVRRAERFLNAHASDRILFGSDSPWSDQASDIAQLEALDLDASRRANLLGLNAARLLGLA